MGSASFTASFAEPLVLSRPRPASFDVMRERARVFGPCAPDGRRNKVMMITCRGDGHADAMAGALFRRGRPICRVDVDDPDGALSLALPSGPHDGGPPLGGTIRTAGGSFRLDEIRSAWLHRDVFELMGIEPLGDPLASFARRESEAALRGLMAALPPDTAWVNEPRTLFWASSKVSQLALATAEGLRVPRTLVTNDPDQALAFHEACGGRVVSKAFHGQIDRGPGEVGFVYTHRVAAGDLERLGLLRAAPCIFQEEIVREAELRITVVGDRLFPVELRRQAAEVDWRRPQPGDRHAPAELPSQIARACLGLMARCHLDFAGIDMLRTPQGEHVFLEANPHADWLWIEGSTGLPITETLADRLAGP
jgi:glutathione synthase/RimK-type ligase-like ATP-grasp enzyme